MGIRTYRDFNSLGPPGVMLRQTAAGTSCANGVYTGIAFDTVDEDPWGMLVTPANVSVKIPISGRYLCEGVVSVPASVASFRQFVALQFSGQQWRGTSVLTITSGAPTTGVTRVMRLQAGQLINIALFQDSGGAKVTSIQENAPYFNVIYLNR